MKFKPCTGNCNEEGTHCSGCGSSHEEVAAMRKPIDELVAQAQRMNYENVADFANAVAAGITYRMSGGH